MECWSIEKIDWKVETLVKPETQNLHTIYL